MTGPPDWSGVDDLYRAITPDALKLARLITGDQALAEDLVHDVFIRMVSRAGAVADLADPQRYLNQAVVNAMISHKRSITARLQRHLRFSRELPQTSTQPPVEEQLGVLAQLRTLPIKTRTVLVLTYYYDYSDATISQLTTWPIGTIKSLRARGLATLRKAHDNDLAL